MRNPNRHTLWIIILILSLWSFSAAQTAPDIRQLEQGKPIERELAGGEVHAYSIQLKAGQFLSVIVDQRGIDVVVTLFGPDGKQLIEVDSPNGTQGPEPVSFVAKSSGAHHIKVRSLERAVATGRYEVRVEALREATPEDKKADRIKAFAATLAAVNTEEERVALLAKEPELVTVELWKKLNDLGRPFVIRSPVEAAQALITFRLALSVAEQAGYREGIAESLRYIGIEYHNQKNFNQALEHYQKSLSLSEELADKRLLATLLVNIGVVHRAQGNSALALDSFQKALLLSEKLESKALLLVNIGSVHRAQGNSALALDYYQKALSLSEKLEDKALLAQTLLNIGQLHQGAGNDVQAQEAFQRSLGPLEATGNKASLANVLSNMGMINFLRGDYPPALRYYGQALKLGEELANKSLVATALNKMSLIFRLQGDFAKALEHGQRALTLSEPLGNKGLTANILISIGLVYGSQGDVSEALAAYRRSLTFSEESGDKGLVADALEKIGGVYHSQGKIEQALEHLQKSLKLVEELGNKRQIIFTTIAIASVNNSQGNYSQALEYFQKSLKLSEEIGNKFQIATALSSIGIVYSNQGDYPQALHYYQRAWRLREEIGEARGIVASINNVGTVYALQGNYAQALEYFQKTLKLSEKIGSKGMVRTALNNIGEMYLILGDYLRALEASRRSLAMSEELGNKLAFPETMNILASIYLSQGNYLKALEMAERATTIGSQTGDRAHLWNSRAIAGRTYRALNQPDKALDSFREAISTIESLRIDVAGQSARASYFATAQKPYELYIDVLMQLHKQHPSSGHDAAALQTSERARARSLLEALSEARADIRQGVDLVLLLRERSVQQRLNAVAGRQTGLLTEKHTEEQVVAVKKEIAALTAEFQDVQTQIRHRSPRYAALTQPVPLSLQEIQATVLDADTLLLEYALGEERSYLWAVTPTSISSYELPKRVEIEAAVRRAVKLLSDGKQWATSNKVESEYAEVAGLLTSMLLDPVAAQLKGKRLLIVGDGALQYLPFGALPSPKSKVQGPKSRSGRQVTGYGQPLIVQHEIVSLPSASTLAVLRRETANRERPTKSIAVLADPVFERDDERLNVAATGNQTASSTSASSASRDTVSQTANSRHVLERAFGLGLQPATAEEGASREILRIPRLPFTRREADAILAIAPAGEGMKALDFRASRETATNAEIGQYAIVHFATHGLLNSEHPELSGIVLSLVNEAGEPVDGFLRLHEIYNLKLSADMVVLSACQTGLGKEIRGEGLVGLTRGFMYAGSPRVVASLWKVADAATAELMTRFYQGMLKDNLRPAAALRAAKVEMWKQKRWKAPFYWAAFELQGEWK